TAGGPDRGNGAACRPMARSARGDLRGGGPHVGAGAWVVRVRGIAHPQAREQTARPTRTTADSHHPQRGQRTPPPTHSTADGARAPQPTRTTPGAASAP